MKSNKFMKELGVHYSQKNSMLYWWPLVKDLGIPMPKTAIVKIPHLEMGSIIGGDPKQFMKYMPEILEAIKEVGGYPVFMRSDVGSGKHEWSKTCYVPNEDQLYQHIANLIEWHEMVDIIGLNYQALVFREMLPLMTSFRAFMGFPVNKERRYFIRNGRVQCHHHYWIEGAVEEGRPTDVVWRNKLFDLNLETREEITKLTKMAEKLSKKLKGYWSVDFAMTNGGKWYFLDAALGATSYHIPTCK